MGQENDWLSRYSNMIVFPLSMGVQNKNVDEDQTPCQPQSPLSNPIYIQSSTILWREQQFTFGSHDACFSILFPFSVSLLSG